MNKANAAGCYALTMCVDGEDLIVVVDDWFPFYIDREGKEKFAFSRNKETKHKSGDSMGEMWVQLMEKAWAKVCGSYEASEMGNAAEALNNIDGTPCQTWLLADVEARGIKDILWTMIEEADRERYVATCTVDSTQRCSPELLDMFGLCDYHSYTLMQAEAVQLQPGSKHYRYLIRLRNPWGRKEWKGPWSDHSKTWDQYEYINKELRTRCEQKSRS